MKPLAPKVWTQWAIYNPWGQIVSELRYTRRASIKEQVDFAQLAGWERWTWEQQYRDGFRCIRVKVIPAEGGSDE